MAVYTDVAAEDLADFLNGYDIGDLLSYKGIAEGVENSNYLLHTSKGTYILTLYEKRVAADDLPYFLSLMTHLAARGVHCPQPEKNRRGEVYSQLAGRPAAIINFLDGMWPRRPLETRQHRFGARRRKLIGRRIRAPRCGPFVHMRGRKPDRDTQERPKPVAHMVPLAPRLTRSRSARNRNAFTHPCVVSETVEKARNFKIRSYPAFGDARCPLHRASAFGDSAEIDPLGFIDFPKFLPILQRIEAGGQSGPALLGRDDHALFRSVLRPK